MHKNLPEVIGELLDQLSAIEHGFKHIQKAGDDLLKDETIDPLQLSQEMLGDERYQVRSLATHLLGCLAPESMDALELLTRTVSHDTNWRVQEMLAKALDYYCSKVGYGTALPAIKSWTEDTNPFVQRAIIEGLRIWTSRPFFKDHPEIAVSLIASQRNTPNEYLRKSIGNSLRDIRRKHTELVDQELQTWDQTQPGITFIKKLVLK